MKLKRVLILIGIVLAFAACHRGPRQIRPRVNPELLQLSKEQAFQKAEDLYNAKKYARARTYYQYVYETYPNDPVGRRSLLRIADTFYGQGDAVNLVEAQYKYRDFVNRYPTSEMADYASLQMAMVSFKQMEKPDRDQQKTKEAVEKLNDFLRTYPKSSYRAEGEKRLAEAYDRLAKHEHIVAKFYIKRRSYPAAVQRLNYLIDTYTNYSDRAGAFYDLGYSLEQLGRRGEARLYFERVITEYPKSDYADRAQKRLAQLKA